MLAVFTPPFFHKRCPFQACRASAPSLPAATACTENQSSLRDTQSLWAIWDGYAKPGVGTAFASAFQTSFAATATQLTLLPLANPASGFVYQYDPQTGLYSRTTQSLGPVLTERGETIGRHKFAFGGTYQRFRFQNLGWRQSA